MGCKGVYITRTCYHDEGSFIIMLSDGAGQTEKTNTKLLLLLGLNNLQTFLKREIVILKDVIKTGLIDSHKLEIYKTVLDQTKTSVYKQHPKISTHLLP